MLDKFEIGHYTDDEKGTGCTVILSKNGAAAGVSVRGAAPATRETDLLKNGKSVQKINAVVLSGGSAFGLEAACGVMDYLYEQGVGYDAGKYRVPIVCGASVYDLEYKSFAYPDKKAGYEAAKNAKKDNFIKGFIGGGTGAFVSKIAGMDAAVRAGVGVSTFSLNGVEIAVITVVNALGDVVNNGNIILGAKNADGSYIDCRKILSAGSVIKGQAGKNTTIGCIITNARINKEQANILADIAHDGLALSLSPSHTRFDGDAIFCMASGEKDVDINVLCAVIPELAAKSVQSAAEDNSHISHKVNSFAFKLFQKAFKRKD